MKETIDFILMLALLGVTIWLGDKEGKEEEEHSIWETNNKKKR